MDDECPPEVIRQQMEETRSQLSEKLEILETQITDTVQSTSNAVSETVEAVKGTVDSVTESVQDTMHSVGEALDLRLQAERHPWLVFGGAVAAGFVASGYLFPARTPAPVMQMTTDSTGAAVAYVPTPAAPPRESWLGNQMRLLRGMAVGALMDVVRDIAAKGLPRPNVRPPDGSSDEDITTAPFRASVSGKRTA